MNYFEILNCDINSTTVQIKENYKSLVLKYHPDKCQDNEELFLKINEAWNVLKDEHERKLYESQLMSQESSNMNIYKSVGLEEMNYDETLQVLSYPCRCGAEFAVDKNDIHTANNEETVIVACDTCSLLLKIIATRQSL